MTDEKKAEKIICGKCSDNINRSYTYCPACTRCDDFIKGLAEGRKEKQEIIDTQTDEIEDRDINLAKKESIIIRQQNEIQKLEKENAELKEQVESLANTNIKAQNIIADLKEQNEAIKQEFIEAKYRNEEYIKQIKKLEKEISGSLRDDTVSSK